MIGAEGEDQPVDMLGGDAGLDLAHQHVEAFGREPSGLAHAREGSGPVDLDLAGFAQWRTGRVDVVHGFDEWRGVGVSAANVSITGLIASNRRGPR